MHERRIMERLTTNKNISEMGMYELAHNCCYVKDGSAMYRDFDTDIDVREFARKLMVAYGHWKSCEEYGLDADNELIDDDIFDETMMENLMYNPYKSIGLIALFYRNLWAMADLLEKLKYYEDLEEQGKLLKLPCKVGDKVFIPIDFQRKIHQGFVTDIEYSKIRKAFFAKIHTVDDVTCYEKLEDFGRTIFLTHEKADKALREMKGGK